MASREVERALANAATKVLGRAVTERELRQIVESYERATGRPIDRAIRGLAQGTGLTEQQILQKSAASDDTKRVIQDLQNFLDQNGK